jgi:glycosyltransferase involved in cell wall biosynthesis
VTFNAAACAAGMRHIWKRRPEVDSMNVPRHLVWLDWLAYHYADAVVVSSHNIRGQFERFYGTRANVYVIPYAEDPLERPLDRGRARDRFGLLATDFTIGFIGRLDPCKDVPFLLRALTALPLRPTDRLLIIGTGPDEARIRKIATDLRIAEHLVWAGQQDSAQEALAAMDVLVLPSVYEAFGLVQLEAMAAGIPVIARKSNEDTVFTAASEVVPPEAGIVIPPDDERSLAEALALLRSDPMKRQELGAGGQRLVSQRNWDDVAREMLPILTGRPGIIAEKQ